MKNDFVICTLHDFLACFQSNEKIPDVYRKHITLAEHVCLYSEQVANFHI